MLSPFVVKILLEIASDCNVHIYPEDEFAFVGEIVFANGRRQLFNNAYFNINPSAAVEIAKDKHYSKYFLSKYSLPVAVGQTFFAPEYLSLVASENQRGITELYQYAKTHHLPLYLKANNLSQGKCVFKVYQEEQIAQVAEQIFRQCPVLLAEIPCAGNDYRLLVLDNQVLIAYQRLPLSVIGDGQNTIDDLIKFSIKQSKLKRPNIILPLAAINLKLAEDNLVLSDILPMGKRLVLLDQANLSCGGSAIDCSEMVDPSFQAAAIQAAQILGLRFCGVDIIASDISRSASEQDWVILELNAAPGLDHYFSLGEPQEERVRAVYRQIIRLLATA